MGDFFSEVFFLLDILIYLGKSNFSLILEFCFR
jgi:hypothetical protein